MHSVALIFASGFEEIEAITPYDLLKRAGIPVTTYGLGSLSIESSRGMTITADQILDVQSIMDNHSVLLLPGGPAAELLASSEDVIRLVEHFIQEPRMLAAICASPSFVLGKSFLSKRKITCYPGTESAVCDGIVDQEQEVIVDKNLITGRGPGSATPFSLKIIEVLTDRATADRVAQEELLYTGAY